MTARDDLLAALRWRDHPVGDPAQHEAELDAYRDEVRREVLTEAAHAEAALGAVRTELDRIAALRTVNRDETSPDRFSVGARWTIRLIRDALGEQPFEAPAEMVDDELRHMAAADDAPPPAGEATQPPDFFQPGGTYQRRRWTFHCRNVSTAPTPKAGLCAIGFLTRTDGTCTVHVLGPDHWASEGWVDVTETEQPTAPADRFPYLGTGSALGRRDLSGGTR